MILEKDEFLISLRSKKLLKAYLGFIIADIIGILFIQNVFIDFDIYVYTLIRTLCISLSISICMLRQVVVIVKELCKEYRYIFNELDTEARDEDGDVTDEQWTEIKKVLKIIWAAVETGVLFIAQTIAIIYFGVTFFKANGVSIVICLLMLGTLIYLSRSYLNKKYCM